MLNAKFELGYDWDPTSQLEDDKYNKSTTADVVQNLQGRETSTQVAATTEAVLKDVLTETSIQWLKIQQHKSTSTKKEQQLLRCLSV